MLLQQLQRLARDRLHGGAELPIQAKQKVVSQLGNVVFPLMKRRQMERDAANAIVQITPKAILGNHRVQILIGRRDDANIDLERFIAADALKLAVLQEPQHLGLRGKRHVANLIEKNRAAMALLEFSNPLHAPRR